MSSEKNTSTRATDEGKSSFITRSRGGTRRSGHADANNRRPLVLRVLSSRPQVVHRIVFLTLHFSAERGGNNE